MKKIYNHNEDLPLISKKIVFTNGCFDILHPGHLQYLKSSKDLGDYLVVGLNSDQSISRIKGKNRPINTFQFRSLMLSYLDFVDFIIEFDENTPLELIKKLKPNILVKGSDYFGKEVIGSDFVSNNGGEIIYMNFLEGYSSTSIIHSILKKQSL